MTQVSPIWLSLMTLWGPMTHSLPILVLPLMVVKG